MDLLFIRFVVGTAAGEEVVRWIRMSATAGTGRRGCVQYL
jgi:hypothetical protein